MSRWWRAVRRSWRPLLVLHASATKRGWATSSCCSYTGPVTPVQLLTGSRMSLTSGCCGLTQREPPPPSHLAALRAPPSPGSGRPWELWRYLRPQRHMETYISVKIIDSYLIISHFVLNNSLHMVEIHINTSRQAIFVELSERCLGVCSFDLI